MQQTYAQLTRHTDGEFIQVPVDILKRARLLAGPDNSAYIHYERGGYDHVRESVEKLSWFGKEVVTRPTGPIGKHLDFYKALLLIRENPALRCMVSHSWPVIDDQIGNFAVIEEGQELWLYTRDWEITGHQVYSGQRYSPGVDEALWLWDVYYRPDRE